jgi:hypothetical protein
MEQVLVQQVSAGAEYWQNRADYQLTAKLDENNEISGTGIITLTG